MNLRERWRRASFAVAVILALLIPSQPASPQGGSGARGPKAQDERLKQTVTSRVLDQPLRTWLERLGQETGVRLKMAPDYEDRTITVRVKAMPLGEVMEAVASLYGDTWRRGGKKEEADYVLEASLARRSRQRLLLARRSPGLVGLVVAPSPRHPLRRYPARHGAAWRGATSSAAGSFLPPMLPTIVSAAVAGDQQYRRVLSPLSTPSSGEGPGVRDRGSRRAAPARRPTWPSTSAR